MKKRIYLADLTHMGKGIHASTFPLGAAFVCSYAKKMLGDDFEIKLFKFPDKLTKELIDNPPHSLCISNYSWNLELGYKICSLAKEKNPDLIVISGGPNFPVLPEERIPFLKKYKNIDFYIQNEGEVGFVELVKKIQEYGFDIAALKENKEKITNCVYLNKKLNENNILNKNELNEEELIEGPFQRILDPNIIPSPYLNGTLDEFFDFPLSPLIETTRGCPFTCAFCADGLISKSRITRFSPERTKKELQYITEHIKNVDELIVTDLNFGMYKEDVVTAKYIAELQEKYNWPISVQGSAGKNNKKQVIEVATILNGSWTIGAAIQSSDLEVLKNIKRNNISLETYQRFLEFSGNLSEDAVPFTEIILGLPGDTKEKHFESLRYGIENGAKTVRMYQAILLTGTVMAAQQMRHEQQFLTRFRIIPGGVGIYQFGNQSFSAAEIEEIIVGSKYLSFEDYVSCRIMDLLVETYFNNALFEEIFLALKEMNISVFDCLLYLHKNQELFTSKTRKIISEFVDNTKNDLYISKEEAEEYVSQPGIIQKYIFGELGINELLVNKADLYLELEDISNVLLQAVKNHLGEKGLLNENAEKYFEQLIKFILCKKNIFYKCEEEIKGIFNYDFKDIDKLKYKIDPRTIKQNSSQLHFKFYHDNGQKKHIQNTLNLYMNTPSGLGRVIQQSNLKKMNRNFEYCSEEKNVEGSLMVKKAFVNKELCIGCSICADRCPEVFTVKENPDYDNDFKCFTNDDINQEQISDKIEEAIDLCPVQCISWCEKK